jgi:hypothetical protein
VRERLTPALYFRCPIQAGIAASGASYKQVADATRLYALNMQFSGGAAQSDKINNLLLLSLGSGGAPAVPTPDQFSILLSRSVPSALTALIPYAPEPSLYMVQVPAFLQWHL